MRVLIAGCGQVGTQVGRALIQAGHSVWGIRRRAGALPASIVPVSADLTLSATLLDLPEVDVLVYAAAADSSSDEAYRAAYPLGLRNVLGAPALRTKPPSRVLFTSTTAVYAQQDGEWVDEASATNPTHFSGRRTLEAEATLAEMSEWGIAIRCGGIYGPGRTRLLNRVASGEAQYPASGPLYSNRIHLDDVVGALIHLMQAESPEKVYNCVDNDPAEIETVLRFLATELGAPSPTPNSSPSDGRRRRTNKRCRNSRLRASGYSLRYPSYREGYVALIEAHKSSR